MQPSAAGEGLSKDGNTSEKSYDSPDRLITTVDLHDFPERVMNNENSDIEQAYSKYSVRTTDKTYSDEEEFTEAISSSLLNTPKTVRASSQEYTGSDLDEIALLISQATPTRRVIIKKKDPEVSIKGYNKTCNEKLIFSGNKITHVKTDRKTMCRNLH